MEESSRQSPPRPDASASPDSPSQQPPESTTGWPETAWIFLASLSLLCAMALPGLLGAPPSLDDLGALHHPLRGFYASCLARGHAFDWMPSLFGGCFITGEGELGAYHPFHLLIYRLFSPATAFQIELLSGYPFLFAGMVFFLRGLVPRRDAAWFGAMVFTFSAYTTLHFVHPHLVAVTAHIPWLLTAIRAVGKHPDPIRNLPAAALALLTASQLLLGHPPSIWLSLLSEAAWAGFIYRFNYLSYLRIAVFKGLGLLIGMLQLLPTWDILQESARNHPDPDFLMNGSWHPINLFQLLSPYLTASRVIGFETHEFALYVGAVPLTLGVWFFLSPLRGPARTGLSAFLALSLILSLILASGSFGGLALVQTWLPLVGKFRVPARALLFVHLIWSVLAALAWSAITLDPDEKAVGAMRRVTWFLASLSILIPTGLFLLFGEALPLGHPAGIAAGPILFFLAGVICQGLARKALWAVPAAILLTVVDLGCYGISYAIYSPASPELERWMRNDAPYSPGDRIAAIPRTFGNTGQSGMGNRFLLLGLRQIDGYLALEPKSRLFGTAASIPALRAAGVAWIPAIASPTQPELLHRVSENWYKVPDPAPRIRLVTNAVQSLRPDRDILKIDPLSTVLTERRIDLEPGVPGTATLLDESPGILAIRTAASSTQLLAIADRFHSGWQATIDGQAAELLRINGDFLGLIVASGTHRISLEFRPSSLIWGRRLSLLGLLLLFLVVWAYPRLRAARSSSFLARSIGAF